MKLHSFIPVAEITNTVNKQGDLGLVVFPGFANSFSELGIVYIDVYGDKRKFIVENFQVSTKGASVKFSNFDSADDVGFLLGKEIYVPEDKLTAIKKENFLLNDLNECSVYYKNEFFGFVINVEHYPGNDVISIRKQDGSEVLLPYIDEYFGNVDISAKKIELIKKVEFTDDKN